ncbi:MAG: hypothetical protein MUF21_04530 [Gemmatimonadaceae bacterium]|jgi:hypothetical protein|nr:hypothetical protein [Gemmatimonadaceae bacterium]
MPTPLRTLRRVLALVAGTATLVTAQVTGDTASTEAPKAAIGIQFGAVRYDVADLNRALATRGRPGVDATIPVAGIETWVRFDRVILGVTGQSYVQRRTGATFFDTESGGGSASLDVGLAVVKSRSFLLYPSVGLGASRLNVTFRQRGDVNFPDVIVDPERNTDIAGWNMQGMVGAGLVKVWRPSFWNVMVTLDARGGYVAPLGGTNWSSGRWDVNNAPDVGQRGYYVRAGVGLVMAKRIYALTPAILTLLPYATGR